MCKIFHRLALRKYFSLATLPLCRLSDVTSLYSQFITNHKTRGVKGEESTRNCFQRRKKGICSILLMERCYVRSHSLKWCYRFFVNLSFCPKTLSTLFQLKRAKMKKVFTFLLRSSELIIQLCCIYIYCYIALCAQEVVFK